jgi:hypothetical protein
MTQATTRTPRAPSSDRSGGGAVVCQACGKVPALGSGWTHYKKCGHVVGDCCRVGEPYRADRRWRCPVCRGRVAPRRVSR